MDKPITIKNIARQANVAMSTVSRALQNKTGISERKREEIKLLAKQMGYQPDLIAQTMKGQILKIIGVLIPDNTNPYYAGLLKCVEATARNRDYNVIIINTDEKAAIEMEAIAALNSLRVAGILAAPVEEDNYLAVKKPLLFISRCTMGEHEFNYIVNDDVTGSYLATNHLIERGYREPVFFCGPKDHSISVSRLVGYKQALEANDIAFKPERVFYGIETLKDGYNALMKLLFRSKPPVGVFCMNDYIAIGVQRAVVESNLQLAKDVAIVGYDDIELTSYLEHPLTTVRQSRMDISKWGIDLLIDMIESPTQITEKVQRIVKPQLIIRSTT